MAATVCSRSSSPRSQRAIVFGETSAREARSRTPTRTGAEIEAGQHFVRLADALREEGGYGDRRPEVLTAQFRDKRADN